MKYNQPFDQPGNPNAGYVNGNPAIGVPGSIPPGAALEYPQREIVQAISDVGLAVPSNLDLTQLSAALRFMRTQFAVDEGTVNNINVALSPTPAQWATPLSFFVEIAYANTSQSVFCQIAGLPGTKSVLSAAGTPLAIGALTQGSVELFAYDGVALRVMSAAGGTGTGITGIKNIQVITTSRNYVPTAGVTYAVPFATGGGGGGGGSGGAPSISAGAGGGAGGTSLAFVNVSGIGSIPCTVGAGGTGGPAGGAIGTTAGNGGQTSFGNYAIGNGGAGGANSGGANESPGNGGAASNGLLNMTGNPGGLPVACYDSVGPAGGAVNFQGGPGGGSFWGGAGTQIFTYWSGSIYEVLTNGNATGWGGGGAGGSNGSAGGAGYQGVIVVFEF